MSRKKKDAFTASGTSPTYLTSAEWINWRAQTLVALTGVTDPTATQGRIHSDGSDAEQTASAAHGSTQLEFDVMEGQENEWHAKPDSRASAERAFNEHWAREDAWCDWLFGVANHLDGSQADAYRAGAERGVPEDQFNLACLQKEGVGVPLDRVEAYMWLELAATQESDEGIQRRARTRRRFLALELTPDEVAEACRRADAWASSASDTLEAA